MIASRMDLSAWDRNRGVMDLSASFRRNVVSLEHKLKDSIAQGEFEDVMPDCSLRHWFVPKSEEYGCHTYAREFTMPTGALVIGKIHRHPHLNFISKGRVLVATEQGTEVLAAPTTFISQPGTKRAVYVIEECVWTTVHLTRDSGEENLDSIEHEVIAPSYDSLELARQDPEMLRLIEEVTL